MVAMKELWTLKFLPPNPIGMKTIFLPSSNTKSLNPKDLLETLIHLQKFFREVIDLTAKRPEIDQIHQIEELTRVIKEIDKWLAKNILFK